MKGFFNRWRISTNLSLKNVILTAINWD